MAAKRTATSDLNADNWNQEDEPEDPGTFQRASDDIISRRVVKTARRRLPAQSTREGAVKSAFGSFTGFKTTGTSDTSSPFSFIRANSDNNSMTTTSSSFSSTKIPATNGSIKVPQNGINTSTSSITSVTSKVKDTKDTQSESTEKQSTSPKKPAEYYAKLKGLNQGVAQWIKTHVDANPVCILTPIFRDYEKYLKEIELKHGKEIESSKVTEKKLELDTKSKETESTKKPLEEKKQTGFIFGGSTSKSVSEGQSIFGNSSESSKSIFSSSIKSDSKSSFMTAASSLSTDKSIFSIKPSTEIKKEEESNKSEEKPSTGLNFPQTTSSSGLFSFGQSSSSNTASAGFTFGTVKPLSFGTAMAKPQDSENKTENNEQKEEDDDEPPKPDFKPITEEGSIFEQKVKVFVKKDDKYGDRGVGTLFLKPTPNDKMQLIVRAVNSLGNLLLNTLLTESIPVKRINKTNIMIVCLPMPTSEPPPVATLLRVKTPEEADALLEALEKHKK